MALKMTVDSLEDVPEELKSLYVPKDGQYALDVQGAEDTSGLKSALEAERKARRDADKKLASYREVDPEDYARLKRQAQLREAAQAGPGWSEQRAKLETRHQAELKTLEDRLTAMRSALEQNLIDTQAAQAIAQAGGSVPLLLPHVKAQTKLGEENGHYQVQVLDDQGQPRLAPGTGKPMTLADLVAEMRASQDYGRAFDGLGASGSGSGAGLARGSAPSVSVRDHQAFMANVEKIAAGRLPVSLD